jgi:hypothetical protein
MTSRPRNLGRGYLVAKLQERGCSRRQSVEILNLVFREMSKALKGGKKVEFPFGQLRKVRADRSLNVNFWNEWPRELFTVELVSDEA